MNSPLLKVESLVVDHYVGRVPFRRAVRAVNGVSLHIEAGERVAIVGPSGCGKTSLLRAACGLYPVASGRSLLLGSDPAPRRRPPRGVQLLFQDAGASLHPGQTVRETLAESAQLHQPGVANAVRDALFATELSHRADARPEALSGGEKRRVSLARLLLARPRLTLADEPTAGLDAARKADLLNLLLSRLGPENAIVLVTHDLAVARYACTRIVTMEAGEIVADEPTRLGPSTPVDVPR